MTIFSKIKSFFTITVTETVFKETVRYVMTPELVEELNKLYPVRLWSQRRDGNGQRMEQEDIIFNAGQRSVIEGIHNRIKRG